MDEKKQDAMRSVFDKAARSRDHHIHQRLVDHDDMMVSLMSITGTGCVYAGDIQQRLDEADSELPEGHRENAPPMHQEVYDAVEQALAAIETAHKAVLDAVMKRYVCDEECGCERCIRQRHTRELYRKLRDSGGFDIYILR